ncbi:hypothetical protein ACGVWS_10345 [Enterobacteriaceae bacterium LUAb1]
MAKANAFSAYMNALILFKKQKDILLHVTYSQKKPQNIAECCESLSINQKRSLKSWADAKENHTITAGIKTAG